MKKVISVFLSMLIIATIAFRIDFTASAVDVQLKTLVNVPSFIYEGNGQTCSNHSGISVGTANSRLFTVKSSSDESTAILYYFNNIYDKGFSDGTKAPKKLLFTDSLMGHANAMAIDDNNIYVTKWQLKEGGNKSSILQVSRKAISLLSDGFVVTNKTKTVKDPATNTNVTIHKSYDPISLKTGEKFTKSIAAITRLTYDKVNNITKFIVSIGRNQAKTEMYFAFATLDGETFTVDDRNDKVFKIDYDTNGKHVQDIFYYTGFGLLVGIWNGGTSNSILQVDIRPLVKGGTQPYNSEPNVLNFSRQNDAKGQPLSKYEIESISCIVYDANGVKLDKFRLIASFNKVKVPDQAHVGDGIDEIINYERTNPKDATENGLVMF